MPRILHHLHRLWQRHRSMGHLRNRADDRLLRDIGITRDDLNALLQGDDSRIAPRDDRGFTGARRCVARSRP